jgi:hypothetical protein
MTGACHYDRMTWLQQGLLLCGMYCSMQRHMAAPEFVLFCLQQHSSR